MLFAEKLFAAVESVNSAENQVFSDATSFGENNSPMLLIDDSSTPKKKQSFSQEVSTFVTSYNTCKIALSMANSTLSLSVSKCMTYCNTKFDFLSEYSIYFVQVNVISPWSVVVNMQFML